MSYKLHPLCTIFPRMEGEEFETLKSDISTHGLRQAITLHDGMVLDGGNRYRACEELGMPAEFVEFDGGNPAEFVLSMNLHRRHMEVGQYAAIVSCTQDWARAQPAYRPGKGAHGEQDNDTAKDRAAKSGASVSTQRRADAVAKADPEMAKQVAQGKVPLSVAVKAVAPQMSRDARAVPLNAEQAEFVGDYELEEAREAIRSLSTENDQLKDRLAIGSTDEPEEAKATVLRTMEEIREQIRCLEIENAAIKASRNHFQSENAELKKQVAYWRKQAEKAA